MSKERLEEIKRQFNINKSKLIRLGRNTHVTDDYEWLIEQAERVEQFNQLKLKSERYEKGISSIESEVRHSVIRNTNNYEEGYLDGLNAALFFIRKELEEMK